MPFYADELENTGWRYDTIDKNISESAETITFTFSIFFSTESITFIVAYSVYLDVVQLPNYRLRRHRYKFVVG